MTEVEPPGEDLVAPLILLMVGLLGIFLGLLGRATHAQAGLGVAMTLLAIHLILDEIRARRLPSTPRG